MQANYAKSNVTPLGCWDLALAGPDENGHRADVQAEINRLGIGDYVTWVGAVSDHDKWQLFIDSDLFVLPSYSENFGTVIAEAMAAGLPVIASTGTPWKILEGPPIGMVDRSQRRYLDSHVA